ncbi:class I alpha-mannosidase [Aspergillus luchuensis]|uniref:Class I alpha-mannosidase n=1 Tax=Aspergillus kawachii TaxID=1069201 RepID=A0A146FW47_ASPKA|nr:class I alpha-mannosidase [Aspergillus luchuensis]
MSPYQVAKDSVSCGMPASSSSSSAMHNAKAGSPGGGCVVM